MAAHVVAAHLGAAAVVPVHGVHGRHVLSHAKAVGLSRRAAVWEALLKKTQLYLGLLPKGGGGPDPQS